MVVEVNCLKGNEVYEIVLKFIDEIQGRSERFVQRWQGARALMSVNKLKEKNGDGEHEGEGLHENFQGKERNKCLNLLMT